MEKIKTTEGGREKAHYCWKKDIDEARNEGLVAGREEGLAEDLEKLMKTAKSMREDGMPPEKISQYTGLPVSEIEKLPLTN